MENSLVTIQKRFKTRITGKTFGKLTVLRYRGHNNYDCQCGCGNATIVNRKYLINGLVDSCLNCGPVKGQTKLEQVEWT